MTEKTAVVIGASMAGLLAARALASHFDRVVVLERDELPDEAEVRNGVPQGKHIHALLAEGQERLERIFPGLTDELTAAGAPRMTWGLDTCYFTPGGWIKRFDTKIQTNVITRPDLEWRVRRRLQANPKITFLTSRDVKGLIATDDKTRVTGVETTRRGDNQVEQHFGDLIVDTTGRNSKAPEWLTSLGYQAPTETQVNSFVGYSTRLYKKPEGADDWKILFCSARSSENNPRGGGIFDIGGGYWLASLGGLNKAYPPTDEAEFMEFARQLPTSTIYDAIKRAEPVSSIVGYRIAGSRMRHYEKLDRRPENFILMGDSVCAFNPIYGQGMTVAAIEGDELDALLKQHGTANLQGFAGEFQKRISKRIQNAWLLATGEDLRFPGTEGDRPNALARLLQRYFDLYMRISGQDEELSLAFLKVLNLSTSPSTLFAPHLIMRVLKLARRQSDDSNNPAERRDLMPLAQ